MELVTLRVEATGVVRKAELKAHRDAGPDASAELPTPLDLAPTPSSRSRRLFDGATIERHLDALEAGQQSDGGWTVSWPDWNAAAAVEWRGVATMLALKTLRANGRV